MSCQAIILNKTSGFITTIFKPTQWLLEIKGRILFLDIGDKGILSFLRIGK